MGALRRVRNGSLNVNNAVTIDELAATVAAKGTLEGRVISAAAALQDLAAVSVGAELVNAIGSSCILFTS